MKNNEFLLNQFPDDESSEIIRESIKKVVAWLEAKGTVFAADLRRWQKIQSVFDEYGFAAKEFYWSMDTMARDYVCDKKIVGENEKHRVIVSEFFGYTLLYQN